MAVGCSHHAPPAVPQRSSGHAPILPTRPKLSGSCRHACHAAHAAAAAAAVPDAAHRRVPALRAKRHDGVTGVRRRGGDVRVSASTADGAKGDATHPWQSFDPDSYDYFDDDDTDIEETESQPTAKVASSTNGTTATSSSNGVVAAGGDAAAVAAAGGAAAIAAGQASASSREGAGGEEEGAASAAKRSRRRRRKGPWLHESLPETPIDLVVAATVSAWVSLITLLLSAVDAVRGKLVAAGAALGRPVLGAVPRGVRRQLRQMATQLPSGPLWAKLAWLWEQPMVRSVRMAASVANWGVRLPAIAALILTQASVLTSQVSLAMLAPLLLGTGMLLRSIKANAAYIIPRVGLLFVLLWMCWFAHSVVQRTLLFMQQQGRLDRRMTAGLLTLTECIALMLAAIVVLTIAGVNIGGLLLPAAVGLALASKDVLQNLVAGGFLLIVAPFRIGDRVAVPCTAAPPSQLPQAAASSDAGDGGGGAGGGAGLAAAGLGQLSGGDNDPEGGALLVGGGGGGWFEGVCESVSLRYTVLRSGKRKLMVPNIDFVNRQFMVYEDPPGSPLRGAARARAASGGAGAPRPSGQMLVSGQPITPLPPSVGGAPTYSMPPPPGVGVGVYGPPPYSAPGAYFTSPYGWGVPPPHLQPLPPPGGPLGSGASGSAGGAGSPAGGGSPSSGSSPQSTLVEDEGHPAAAASGQVPQGDWAPDGARRDDDEEALRRQQQQAQQQQAQQQQQQQQYDAWARGPWGQPGGYQHLSWPLHHQPVHHHQQHLPRSFTQEPPPHLYEGGGGGDSGSSGAYSNGGNGAGSKDGSAAAPVSGAGGSDSGSSSSGGSSGGSSSSGGGRPPPGETPIWSPGTSNADQAAASRAAASNGAAATRVSASSAPGPAAAAQQLPVGDLYRPPGGGVTAPGGGYYVIGGVPPGAMPVPPPPPGPQPYHYPWGWPGPPPQQNLGGGGGGGGAGSNGAGRQP